ncbi:MAG: MCE family protein [Betaproteobacteria bacterium]|nr:MAG: MCE family protein [Betaproteobacteria bacterium]
MSVALPPGRFTRLVLKVNVFLLIALALGAAFMGLVAYKQGWFVRQSPLHFVTPNALGINKGMPVKLHGFTIGQVSELKLAEGGVDVQLSIVSEYLRRIPQGSYARHAREAGVIGTAVIDVVPGQGALPLAEGALIQFQPARGISEIIDDFRRQAMPAFNEVKQAMSQIGRSGEDLTGILAALRREVEQLPATHRAVRQLVEEATKATAELNQQAGSTLAATERVAHGVDRALPALSEKLTAGIESIDAAAVQLKKTGEEAQAALRSARPLLDRGETAAREAGDVLSAAKRIWPLSDSFKDAADGMLPIDSFEAQGKGRAR